ncbi:SDR family NAD(P)-dependent oxidoreductase [Jiella sonneratiae]|uniref:SDR family oxidoreductase n=1 Tax=Jiella sonneratiae TaxID=2816856 RepID=A0ABS3IZH1_9HYPH|nr:SDR family NAD(P)-dependent oxidoreductase [Jiella sonneratiae]MBO0902810.1 SDR family oxidoreductase [Jiella sonneratiae]
MSANEVRLDGRSVVITGAGRGIGRAAALAMAKAGASVVVNDVAAEAAGNVVAEITAAGGSAVAAVAAIGSAEAADLCVKTALEAFGRLDVMATNAGILRDRVLWNTTDEDFDAVVATHLRGTFTCARAAARHFRAAGHGGRLILVSSMAGQRGNFGQTAYAAAKAGIAAFARTWAMELAKADVTVNAVVPNALTTMTATVPMLKPFAEMLERGEALPEKVRKDFGLGGPEDVAALFVYLASERSAGVTGQAIGLGGDRLSVWAHPAEAAHAFQDGGWSAEKIAAAIETELAGAKQSVGIDFM